MRRSRMGEYASDEFHELLSLLLQSEEGFGSDVAVERARFAESVASTHVHPDVDFLDADVDGVLGEWALPRGHRGHPPGPVEPVVLFLHGGGFSVGSPRTARPASSSLAAIGDLAVLSLDYSLAPEHPFPTAVGDVVRAYRWLLDNGSPGRAIAVAGESAGAALALSLLLHVRDIDPLPACAYLMSPSVDLTSTAFLEPRIEVRDPWIPEDSHEIGSSRYLV